MLQTGAVTVEALQGLRLLGVATALDDFGTGYSSLTSIEQLPLTRVKLDRSVIAALDNNPRSAAIAHSIIRLCRSLGLQVTAEGVERPAQLDFLAACGEVSVQGFLIAKPADGMRRRHGLRPRLGNPDRDAAAGRREEPAAAGSRHDRPGAPAATLAPLRPATAHGVTIGKLPLGRSSNERNPSSWTRLPSTFKSLENTSSRSPAWPVTSRTSSSRVSRTVATASAAGSARSVVEDRVLDRQYVALVQVREREVHDVRFPSALGPFKRVASERRNKSGGRWRKRSAVLARSSGSLCTPRRSSSAAVRYSSRQGPDSA